MKIKNGFWLMKFLVAVIIVGGLVTIMQSQWEPVNTSVDATFSRQTLEELIRSDPNSIVVLADDYSVVDLGRGEFWVEARDDNSSVANGLRSLFAGLSDVEAEGHNITDANFVKENGRYRALSIQTKNKEPGK